VLYCFTLPFALVASFGWLTILATTFLAYTLFGIEEIGVEIENPFEHEENDLPLERICKTLEGNLRTFLPAAASPPPSTPAPEPDHA
jgi:putative membrane protein